MSNSTTQRETVVGVFSTREQAQQAIQNLRDAGFNGDDIGVLMQDKQGASDLADETGTKAGEAAGIGATSGGLLGAIGGLLVGLGVMAIPGIGPVLAAGPIVAALGPLVGGTLTGAAIGAGTGALAGALVGLGIPEDEAGMYEDRFRAGAILVTVKSGTARYNEAWQILSAAGAEDVTTGGATASTMTSSDTMNTMNTTNYAQSNTGATAGSAMTDTSNTGSYTTTDTRSMGSTMQSGASTTDADVVRVPVVEEQLTANKQQREAGEVTIRKNVVEEQVSIPVELRHEEVTVTRHAVDRPVQAGEQVLGDGDVIRVPLHEETVNVQKEARVTGEVEINKQVVAEQRTVSDTVRRETVDVDTEGDLEARNRENTGYTSSTTTSTDMDDNKNR